MKKNTIEDKLSVDIENYIEGKGTETGLESEEYKEMLALGKMLADNNFSEDSNKKEVYNITLKKITQSERKDTMKKSNRDKGFMTKVASIALVCIVGFSVTQTSFGQNVVDKVLRTISLGHITIYEEIIEANTYPVPDQLKGKIFDENGTPLEEFSSDQSKVYTANGEEIHNINPETGEIITVTEADKEKDEWTLVVKDPNKLNDYTCFNVILPTYLPEGYEFDRAGFFKDDNGVVENTKYIELYFTNDETGEYMYMQQRFADEETAYSTGSSQVEEIKINGVDAVIYGNTNINLDWEINGVLYMLSGKGMAKDEIIKIAESIK